MLQCRPQQCCDDASTGDVHAGPIATLMLHAHCTSPKVGLSSSTVDIARVFCFFKRFIKLLSLVEEMAATDEQKVGKRG